MPDKGFFPELWEEHPTGEDLLGLSRYAYKSFYTRPRDIVKDIVEVRSF